MAKQNTAPTMKDVAKEAGVSLGTVSKVINGIPVGEEYRKKVEQAIKELDYHLNAYARGLKSNRTNTIAVILPTIAHPYFGLIAHCINSSLQKRGYRMLLCDTDYDNEKEQEMIRMAEQNKVDGIIALTYDPKLEVPSEINSVSIDRYLGANIPCVASDNYAGQSGWKTAAGSSPSCASVPASWARPTNARTALWPPVKPQAFLMK